MNARDEERLHERLMNGTADPGMYPDHWFGCLGQDDGTREREPAPTVDDMCAAGGHAYAGDDVAEHPTGSHPVGRCYCGAVTYPPGGPVDPR